MSLLPALFRSRPEIPLGLTGAEREALTQAASLDDVAAVSLEWLLREVGPTAAYAYTWSQGNLQYRLTASLTRGTTGIATPEPNYSGMMAGAPAGWSAPLSLPPAAAPPAVEVADLGEERWLLIPCPGTCLFRLRLERRQNIPRGVMQRVGQFLEFVTPLAALALRLTEKQREADRLDNSLKAAHKAAQTVLKPGNSAEVLFRLPLGLLGAEAGCLIENGTEEGDSAILAAHGRGRELGEALLSGAAPHLLQIGVSPDLLTGPAVADLGLPDTACVIRIPALHRNQVRGSAYYFLNQNPHLSEYQRSVLSVLGDRFAQVLTAVRIQEESGLQYLETLRSLVTAMDSLSEQTTGHSDRMARYARLTCRAMGLPAEVQEAVALGAYLHDIGMMILDLGVLGSGAKLSPEQIEQMQQHTVLGAELVGMIPAAIPIAPMVQHHHERFDSHGYPHGLRGKEIPLGARIIAACDLFEAKTSNRKNRNALHFARALADLRAAAGTQLDPAVAEALASGLESLRENGAPGLPVARCWVVRQVPAAVCGGCPNRNYRSPVACWENPHHLCSRHGDVCSRCAVYTEVLARSAGGEPDGE